MPPAATTKRRPFKQCVYREGRRQCIKSGRGNPPLCRNHSEIVAEEMAEDLSAEDLIDELTGRAGDFFQEMLGSLQGLFQQPQGQPGRPARPNSAAEAAARAREAARRAAWSRAQAAARARGQQPPPPPKRDNTHELAEARAILNFAPDAHLTREQIKERQRKLAKLFHPDAGGSTAEMQRLNGAAKRLLDSL